MTRSTWTGRYAPKQDKPLTLEHLRNGGVVDRLDNSPRPKLTTGRTRWTLLPQPKPVDYRKKEPV